MEKPKPSHTAGSYGGAGAQGDSLAVPPKVIGLQHDLGVPLPITSLRELQTYSHIKILYIPALFIVSQKWKQPSFPSCDEWIYKCSISIYCSIFQ